MKYILILIVSLASACNQHKTSKNLRLIQAYQVETHNKYEPSGLTLWDGEFYTVSDKHNYIYHLRFIQNNIELEQFIQIKNPNSEYLDFEGISHDDESFYLISESKSQILKVSRNGKQQIWMPKDNQLKKQGQKVGLFQKQNAYFEGICALSKQNFLLVAERDPRGFVEASFQNEKVVSIAAYPSNTTQYPQIAERSTDFTGLSCGDKIYVLERNAYTISEIKKHHNRFEETRGWSYQHIIDKPENQYQDMQYGQAEGLVVKGKKVYIILDNNRNPHRLNSENNNSLFLEMRLD